MDDSARPVLLFDADCGFCTKCAGFAVRLGIEVLAWQSADLAALGITAEQAQQAVQWSDGHAPQSGHRAIAAALLTARRPWRWLGRLLQSRLVSWPAALAYRLIAANRYRLPGGAPTCRVPAQRTDEQPPVAGQAARAPVRQLGRRSGP